MSCKRKQKHSGKTQKIVGSYEVDANIEILSMKCFILEIYMAIFHAESLITVWIDSFLLHEL